MPPATSVALAASSTFKGKSKQGLAVSLGPLHRDGTRFFRYQAKMNCSDGTTFTDGVISDQVDETGALVTQIRGWNPSAPVQVIRGRWRHTAEMRWSKRLPGALVHFGLLRRAQAIQI